MADVTALTRRTLLVAPLALAACKGGTPVIELVGQTMGTTYTVVVPDPGRDVSKTQIASAIDSALAAVNAEMSNWDSSSEISRINQSRGTDTVGVSAGLAEVLAGANEVHVASGGQFDVTLAPLFDLWGFGPGGARGHTPSAAEIAATVETGGQTRSFALNGTEMRKLQPEAEILLSAIGKGHGVDRVARALNDLGLTDYMVEIGGDLYAAGRNPGGRAWQVGVETPDMRLSRVQQIVGVSGMGMATSGDYRNYFEEGGVRYSHILDAETGRPVSHKTASATVLAKNSMLADAWATAMLSLGSARGMEIAESHNLPVLFIDRAPEGSDLPFASKASASFQALQA